MTHTPGAVWYGQVRPEYDFPGDAAKVSDAAKKTEFVVLQLYFTHPQGKSVSRWCKASSVLLLRSSGGAAMVAPPCFHILRLRFLNEADDK